MAARPVNSLLFGTPTCSQGTTAVLVLILHVSFNAEDATQANHPRQRRDGKEKKGQEAKADSTIRFESAMIDAGPMLLPPKLAAVTLSGTKTHQQRRVTNLDSEARMKKQKTHSRCDTASAARVGGCTSPTRRNSARFTWSYVQLSAHLPHVGVRRQLELHARAGGVGTAGENEPLKQHKQGDPTKAGGSTA